MEISHLLLPKNLKFSSKLIYLELNIREAYAKQINITKSAT